MKGTNSVWGGRSEGGLFSLTSLSITTTPCPALLGASPPLTIVMSPPHRRKHAHLGRSVETIGNVVSVTLLWSVKLVSVSLWLSVTILSIPVYANLVEMSPVR
ncbi:hypothetical protein GDO81_023546 [Engystomops pustulosus]|uniref:Uncharacterized protein n=1 Tax=Engystomops pustulosus TaxID=76066 RepID=A0AAV6YKI3_ENGPU|nr:hypothetical protein GDO81_023546 [Engystomops pustulosus]